MNWSIPGIFAVLYNISFEQCLFLILSKQSPVAFRSCALSNTSNFLSTFLFACAQSGQPYVATGLISVVYIIILTLVLRCLLLISCPTAAAAIFAAATLFSTAIFRFKSCWKNIPRYTLALLHRHFLYFHFTHCLSLCRLFPPVYDQLRLQPVYCDPPFFEKFANFFTLSSAPFKAFSTLIDLLMIAVSSAYCNKFIPRDGPG